MQAEEKYNQIASWFNTPEPEPWLETSPETSPEPKPPGLAPRIWSIVNLLITIILLIACIAGFYLVMFPLIIVVSFYLIKRSEWKVAKKEWEKAKKEWEEAKKKWGEAKEVAKKEWEEAVAKYDALPSVSQMEQWLEEDLENLKKGALQQTGLDEESEIVGEQPVITRVPSSEWTPMSTKATKHRGYLFPIWHLTILYTGDKSIAIYRCEYDWSNNRLFSDSITEYFYQDIVEVEKRSMGFNEIIHISLSNGSSDEIFLNEQGSTEPSNRADMAARGIRRMLRDSKDKQGQQVIVQSG